MEVVEIDRMMEFDEEDAEVLVIFEDGYRVRFWLTGLSDDEYTRRAKLIRANEV